MWSDSELFLQVLLIILVLLCVPAFAWAGPLFGAAVLVVLALAVRMMFVLDERRKLYRLLDVRHAGEAAQGDIPAEAVARTSVWHVFWYEIVPADPVLLGLLLLCVAGAVAAAVLGYRQGISPAGMVAVGTVGAMCATASRNLVVTKVQHHSRPVR